MEDEAKLIKGGILHDLNLEQRIVSVAKSLAGKLNGEIEKGHDTRAFMIAILLAGFKDFIDIVLAFLLIGEIPGVNFGVGLFLTSFLFFFMLGKGSFLKWKFKFYFWVFGLFVDGLPVVGALPINTILVLWAWRIIRKRAAKAELKLKNLHTLTEEEMHDLNNDISLLETNYDELKNYKIRSFKPKIPQSEPETKKESRAYIQPRNYPAVKNPNQKEYTAPKPPTNTGINDIFN